MKLRHFLRICASSLAACTISAGVFAQETLVTSSSRFQIPFEIETSPGETPQGFAVLFGSQNGGRSWERLQTVPAAQQHFQFAAPRDGVYAFAVRMMDGQGNLMSSIEGSRPELEVAIDTTPPELSLQLETGPDQLLLRWQVADMNADLSTLKLEYTESQDGRWRKVETTSAASGRIPLRVSPGAVVSVRGEINDTAGNRGTGSAQVIMPGAQSVDRSAGPDGRQQGTEAVMNTHPAGLNPFTRMAEFSGSDGAAGQSAKTQPVQPVTTTVTSELPVTQQATATYTDQMQLVNSCQFDLVYQVQDVGPSGISAVELYVTEDGGSKWFRYGNDADLESPFPVDVQGEGTFGFAVRVRNGLGFADPPPQPGEQPAIVVTVDQTPPVVEFPQPTVSAAGTGTVQLKWTVVEQHPATSPVRLEFAAQPTGPWTPVFDWDADKGAYSWPVPPGSPPSIHFRLLVRDAAGNVATAQTPQPVLIDLKRPTVSGLRIQAVSNSRADVKGF